MKSFSEFIKEDAMATSSAAQQAEIRAFKNLQKLLGKTAIAFAEPAGFETSFPDFGFRLTIGGKKVDLHIEYKADAKAQMGSMRDWVFDGTKFSTPKDSEEKKDLIDIMNASPTAITNGKRLLKDLQKYSDPKIKKISSSSMTIEKDQKERRRKLEAFVKGTDNYQIAKLNDTTMGDKIISHYKKKFKKSQKDDANVSYLLMMIGDTIWLVDKTSKATAQLDSAVAAMLGGDTIPKIGKMQAQLEVRIQPRGLSSLGKPVSIDVMASFRLSGGLGPGLKV